MTTKLEKILFFAFWYISCGFLAWIIPKGKGSGVGIFIVFISIFIARGMWYIYAVVRNRFIQKKVAQYMESNELEQCVSYLDRQIEKRKLLWLKQQKALIVALQGEILEFRALLEEIRKNKPEKDLFREYLEKYEFLFAFLTGEEKEKPEESLPQDTYLDQALRLLWMKEKMSSEEIISVALILYEVKWHLYKSIGALILSQEYMKNGNDVDAQMFAGKAIEYAPSEDVLCCIKKFLPGEL